MTGLSLIFAEIHGQHLPVKVEATITRPGHSEVIFLDEALRKPELQAATLPFALLDEDGLTLKVRLKTKDFECTETYDSERLNEIFKRSCNPLTTDTAKGLTSCTIVIQGIPSIDRYTSVLKLSHEASQHIAAHAQERL